MCGDSGVQRDPRQENCGCNQPAWSGSFQMM